MRMPSQSPLPILVLKINNINSFLLNGRGALAECIQRSPVSIVGGIGRGERGLVCRQYFPGTSFEFADLAPHLTTVRKLGYENNRVA